MSPDVIVVGGGPAGSIAALLLARAGVKVRLFERSRHPRRKLCGDTINPGARAILRKLGLQDAAESGALPVDGMIVSGGGTVVRAGYPRGSSGLAITRAVFDARLLAAAARAGADINEGVLVTGPACEGAGQGAIVGVHLRHRRGDGRVHAPLVIAADGHYSRLAFTLGLSRHARRPRRWAVAAYYSDVAQVGTFGEMHIRTSDYVGVAALPGGLTNVCLVTGDRRRIARPEESLRDLVRTEPLLRDRFTAARRISPVAVLGPLAIESSGAGMNGLLLAGDAAGFIDPMTGDGLRFAIRGAQLAAASALEALSGGFTPAHIDLARRRREFSRKRAFNRTLRWIVDSPRAVGAASLGARCVPSLLRYLVSVAGDVRAA
jgi:geranylgeranyl reductase family protein